MKKKGASYVSCIPTLKCDRFMTVGQMGKCRFGCAESISQIREWSLSLIMFKQFIKRWGEKLDLFAQTLFTEGGNISQSSKGVYSLQSTELSVSFIIQL